MDTGKSSKSYFNETNDVLSASGNDNHGDKHVTVTDKVKVIMNSSYHGAEV
jgi:hypothetical protein